MFELNRQPLKELNFYRGRVALFAILKGLGIKVGDQVLIQSFTCLAVPEAVMATGAQPVYVDIGEDSFNIDPEDLIRKWTPQCRALVIQHTFGIPAEMEPLVSFAIQKGIPVIEDCCHTFASTYHGRRLGDFGVAAFYSYEWGKPIVLGLGGSAVIHDPILRKRVQAFYGDAFHEVGIKKDFLLNTQYHIFKLLYRPAFYWTIRSAFQALSSLGAAEGNFHGLQEGVSGDFHLKMSKTLRRRMDRGFDRLDRVTLASHRVANIYRQYLKNPQFKHPVAPADSETVYARYPLRTSKKEEVLRKAKEHRVEVSGWYATPVHPILPRDWKKIHFDGDSCPRSAQRANEVISLPTNDKVDAKGLNKTLDFLNSF